MIRELRIALVENSSNDVDLFKTVIMKKDLPDELKDMFQLVPWMMGVEIKIEVIDVREGASQHGKKDRIDREKILRKIMESGAHVAVVDIELSKNEKTWIGENLGKYDDLKVFWDKATKEITKYWLVDSLWNLKQRGFYAPFVFMWTQFSKIPSKHRDVFLEYGVLLTIEKGAFNEAPVDIFYFGMLASALFPRPKIEEIKTWKKFVGGLT